MLCFLSLRPILGMVTTQDFIRVNTQYEQLCRMLFQEPNNDIIPPELLQKVTSRRQTTAEKCLESQQRFQTRGMSLPMDNFYSIEEDVLRMIREQKTFDTEMKEIYEDYWSQKTTGLNPEWWNIESKTMKD